MDEEGHHEDADEGGEDDSGDADEDSGNSKSSGRTWTSTNKIKVRWPLILKSRAKERPSQQSHRSLRLEDGGDDDDEEEVGNNL